MVCLQISMLYPTNWGLCHLLRWLLWRNIFGNTYYGDQAPLVGRGSSFHREYEDEVDEDKSMRSDDFNYRSRLTSNQDDSNSNYGTESYAPFRNMFQAVDKEGHVPKETLPGENLEGETTEVVRETSARDVSGCDLSCSGALPVFRSRTCDTHAAGWQVSALCNGVSGSITPWVTLNSMNNTDPNSQYHDFRTFTNDSRQDWYFESMTIMRWIHWFDPPKRSRARPTRVPRLESMMGVSTLHL